MKITIQEVNEQNLHRVNQINSSFVVDSELVLNASHGKVSYGIDFVSPYEKSYPFDKTDYSEYVNNPDKVIFFAYADDELAGQIRVLKYWNAFAYIDDVVVDIKHRKRGIGRALISQAIKWAKEKGFPGLMLETQNNNVGACHLYESCGFELGGFDRNLYKGLHPKTKEIALYWYLVF